MAIVGQIVVKRASLPEDLEAVYRLRYRIFCLERGIYPVEHYRDEREIDEFDEYSNHWIALNGTGAVGTVRAIRNSQLGFPITRIHAFPIGIRPEGFAEVSRLAVAKSAHASQSEILLGLCRIMNQRGIDEGVPYWGARIEDGLHRLLRLIGVPFIEVGNPIIVPGEKVPLIAVFADMVATYRVLTSPRVEKRLQGVKIEL